MHDIDTEALSRKLVNNNKSNSLSVSAEEDTERVVQVTNENEDPLLRLNGYKVPEESLGRKLSKQGNILKAMTASENHLEKKLCSLENEKAPLEKSNDELMKKYGEQNTVLGGSVIKLE